MCMCIRQAEQKRSEMTAAFADANCVCCCFFFPFQLTINWNSNLINFSCDSTQLCVCVCLCYIVGAVIERLWLVAFFSSFFFFDSILSRSYKSTNKNKTKHTNGIQTHRNEIERLAKPILEWTEKKLKIIIYVCGRFCFSFIFLFILIYFIFSYLVQLNHLSLSLSMHRSNSLSHAYSELFLPIQHRIQTHWSHSLWLISV